MNVPVDIVTVVKVIENIIQPKNSQEEAVNKFYVSSFFPLAQALPWHLGF